MRYMWTGTVSMGMVVIPVQLGNAVSKEDELLHQHHRADGGQVKNRRFCALDGEEIPYSDIAKGFTAANGQVALLNDDDFDAVYGERSKQMEIAYFTDVSALPRAAHDSTYVVKPKPEGAKAYALLATAMREAGKAAVVSVMIAQREATAVLHADGDGYLWLERLQWAANVRKPDFEAPNPVLSPAEMKMADNLVREMSGDLDWGTRADPARERLEAVLAAKIAGGQVTGTPAAPARQGAPLDLTAALAASVAAAKAAKAPAPRTRASRKAKAA